MFSSLHQRNCAIHLPTELVHFNCTCIFETLFLEFWRDIDVSCLEVFTFISPNRLRWLLLDILDTVNFLREWRTLEVIPFAYDAYQWMIVVNCIFWLSFLLKCVEIMVIWLGCSLKKIPRLLQMLNAAFLVIDNKGSIQHLLVIIRQE